LSEIEPGLLAGDFAHERLFPIIKLNQKDINGSFNLEADVTAGLTADYQPKLSVSNVDVIWRTEPNLQLVPGQQVGAFGISVGIGPWNINIANGVHDPLRDGLNNALQQVVSNFHTDAIKNALTNYWKSYSFPISLTSKDKVYLNLNPTEISATGLAAEPDCMHWAARIGFDSSISDSPSSPINFGPPSLGVLANPSDLCEINVPIHLSYDFLSNAASDAVIAMQPTSVAIGSETGEVKINKITVYPRQNDLVIGVSFSAKLPSRILSADGDFWLTGKPELIGGEKTFDVGQLAIYDKVNNPLWTAGVELAYPKILAAVKKATTFDLKKSLDDAQTKIVVSLSSLSGPVQCSVKDPQLGVTNLGLDNDGVRVATRFRGVVSFKYHH
jgi:hypothetical protein